MNLNLLSYALFFPVMTYIAVKVARTCHANGRVWMLGLFDRDAAFVDALNRVLLIGCYTVNIGYVAVVVGLWEPIPNVQALMGGLAVRIALILFTLALLHYMNIAVLLIWSHLKHRERGTPRLNEQGPSIT